MYNIEEIICDIATINAIIHIIELKNFLFQYVRHNNINDIVTSILYMLMIMYDIFIYCYISESIIDRVIHKEI